jgi:hypothetical protein
VSRQVADVNREYDEITRSMPSFGVGGSAMRDAVTFYNGSIKEFPSLPEFLKPLSSVLQSLPEMQLTQLSWIATDDMKAMPQMASSGTRGALPVRALPKAGEAAAPGSPPDSQSNPPFAGGRYEIALVEGTVRVGNNDFRGAVERVERLAEAIGRLPGYRAEVAESPLDVRTSIAIQGRHGEREPATMEPRFVLRVIRERGASA